MRRTCIGPQERPGLVYSALTAVLVGDLLATAAKAAHLDRLVKTDKGGCKGCVDRQKRINCLQTRIALHCQRWLSL